MCWSFAVPAELTARAPLRRTLALFPSFACGVLRQFHISGVVPLLHANPTAPVLEAAARVVSQWCVEQRSGESIVGLYFANERNDDESVKPHIAKTAASIHARIGAAAVLQILNRTLGRSVRALKVRH